MFRPSDNDTLLEIHKLWRDVERTAKKAELVYVSDSQPGIRRLRRGDRFSYQMNGRSVRDKEQLDRIKRLAIPPAWKDVWICADPCGHIQSTGIDAKGRKQYRYHAQWNAIRNETKFHRMLSFGRKLPAIRSQLERDLLLPGLPVEKVLAAIVSIMEMTSIRIGNANYEKLYGSFGLTTLKDKHVTIRGSSLRFLFRGKKGITHSLSVRSARLARIVKQCRDIPGKELFQYFDEQGEKHQVDSGMVNDYIKRISGGDFSAKDFRTWTGSVRALGAFRSVPEDLNDAGKKRIVNWVTDQVALHLGNTRTVCRKYYIHPALFEMYETGTLEVLITRPVKISKDKCFSCEELIMLRILNRQRSGKTLA